MLKEIKKILFVHHAAGIGGAPLSMISIIENLDKTKYEAKVLLLKKSIVEKLLQDKGIDYDIAEGWFYQKFYQYFQHIVPSYIKWYQLRIFIRCTLSWILSRYYYANKVLSKYDCDIVHLNSSVLTDWLAPAKKNSKVLIHIREPFTHGHFKIRYLLFTKQMKKYADRIIAISKDNSKRINIPEKTDVVYNFVDKKHFSTDNPDYSNKKVIYIGGQAEIKGFSTIVNSLQHLDDGIKVLFAGSYNDFKRYAGIKGLLKKLIGKKYKLLKKMRASNKSIEIGLANNVSNLIKESIVLVSPFSKEHFSRPIIEAFACSRPAIGTDVIGMNEIIDHNDNGLIIKKKDAKALASAINYLCSNIKVAERMGENGYQKAKKYYSSDNVEQIEAIYYNLC